MRSAAVLLCVAACGLGGCITNGIVIHHVPPETPAADNAAAIKRQADLAAAAQAAVKVERTPDEAPPPLTAADAPSATTYDPWGRLNRFTYRFNARFDDAIFIPVSNGYKYLPSPIRAGVHHFFGNLAEVDSVINYTLQGRLGRGWRSLERFVINSTVGIGGLFDFATQWKLPGAPTGFGTTLAKWGMHPGPYLVIPLLGPSTLRGGVGYLGDSGTDYGINLFGLYQGNVSYGLDVVDAVDKRANVDFRYYSTGSPFEYENIRFLYVRKLLIEDAGLHKKDPPKKREPGVPAGQ
jgi:phospholipid-binding lipoprotein MlaA